MVNLLRFNHLAQQSEQGTAQWLPFEWSHFDISSTDRKFRTPLYRVINSAKGTYSCKAIISELEKLGFHPVSKDISLIVEDTQGYVA